MIQADRVPELVQRDMLRVEAAGATRPLAPAQGAPSKVVAVGTHAQRPAGRVVAGTRDGGAATAGERGRIADGAIGPAITGVIIDNTSQQTMWAILIISAALALVASILAFAL